MATAELRSVLSVNNKPFINGMNEAVAKGKSAGKEIGGAFTSIGPALAGAISAGAVISFGKSVLDLAGDLQDSADKLNINVEALQGLQGAFEQGGVKSEQFDKGMIALAETVQKAKEGDEDAIEVLKRRGVALSDLSRPTEEIIYLLADGAKKSQDWGKALEDFSAILGAKVGPKMLATLRGGSDALREMADAVTKLKERETRDLDAIGDSFGELFRTIKVYAGKEISVVKGEFNDLLEVMKKVGGTTIGDIFGAMGDVKTPKFTTEFPTADNSFDVPDAQVEATGGKFGRGRGLTKAEEAKMDEEAKADEEAAAKEKKSIEDRNEMEQAAYQHRLKMQDQIYKVVRDGIFDGLDGEKKLKVLTAERAKIMTDAAKLGAYTEEEKLAYAEKSVEISKQIRENEKDAEKTAMQNAANSSSPARKAGLRIGDESRQAYHLVRRGDAARAKAEANSSNNESLGYLKGSARSLANIAKGFGLGGVEKL